MDFVEAIGDGVSSRSSCCDHVDRRVTDIMQELPLCVIPFAVPFWIVLHILSLIKLQNPQAECGKSAV